MRRRFIPVCVLALFAPVLAAQEKEKKPESPKRLLARVQMAQIAAACAIYKTLNGTDPKSLRDLVERPEGVKCWPEGGFLIGGKLPRDPWGYEYQWQPGGPVPDLKTLGADGRPGGEGEDADLSLAQAFEADPALLESNERNAVASLISLAVAEADFRVNDRDGNRVNDFWTGDVHALFALCPILAGKIAPEEEPDPGNMIRLIDRELAQADAAPINTAGLGQESPASPASKGGYLFKAVGLDEEGKKYSTDTDGPETFFGEGHNRYRFAFCAYPAEYGRTGRLTFVVHQESNVPGQYALWSKDTAGKPVEQFPATKSRKGWKELDQPVPKLEFNELQGIEGVKFLARAEFNFRALDSDGNRVQDFWTADVHGLFALCPIPPGVTAPLEKPEAANMIRLIPPELAQADAAPLKQAGEGQAPPDKPSPRGGYLFRAAGGEMLRNDTDGADYYGAVHDRNRFAFCAYPAQYGKTGRLTFIVNESNTVWSKDTGGKPLDDFPADPGKDGWKKVD